MVHDMKEAAAISPLAGKPAPTSMLVDLARLEREYYERKPEMKDPTQLVSFGTSGHRGSPFNGSFTEAHIAAITQAICDYRRGQRIDGPLYMGKDTHALSEPAQRTALEVLAANGVETIIQRDGGVTPTPVISWAILVYNRGRTAHLADGIVITPSHNPPEDGGFKYNPPNGGPADTDVTGWIQRRANVLLGQDNADVKRVPFATAIKATTTHAEDFVLALRAGSPERRRHGRDPRSRPHAGRGPTRRSGAAVLGADQRRLQARHRRREPRDRSDLLVHDGGSRRQDPHGSLEPVRHGTARRAEGSVPRRLRQRSRLGPARHRDGLHGADEPQPLSRGGHPLSARPSSAVAGARRRRQDARQQQPDRSRRRAARPAALGSARRLQVVRARPLRRLLLLRR